MVNPAKRWAVSPSGGDDGSARRGGNLLGGLFNIAGAKGRTEYELAMHREHGKIDTENQIQVNKMRFKHQNKYELKAQEARLRHGGVIIGQNADGTPKYDPTRQSKLTAIGDVSWSAERDETGGVKEQKLRNEAAEARMAHEKWMAENAGGRGGNAGNAGDIPDDNSPSGNGGGSGGNGGGNGGSGSGGSGNVTDVTPVPDKRADLIAKLEAHANAEGNTPEEAQAFRDKANQLRHKRDVVAPDDGKKADRNLNPSRTESNVKPTGGNAGANADLGNIQDAAAETVAEGTGTKTTKPKNPRGSGKSKPPKAEATDGGEDDFRINK